MPVITCLNNATLYTGTCLLMKGNQRTPDEGLKLRSVLPPAVFEQDSGPTLSSH